MLRKGLITPFRSTRYHLKEWSSRNPPRTAQELFNHRHASLRNAIERCFSIWKKRFPIIATGREAHYGVKTQNRIIIASCILHNYLMVSDPDEELMAEVDADMANQNEAQISSNVEHNEIEEHTHLGENLRNAIANSMCADYMS
ncbi:unnamed protein product [Cuscuta europaea]|uniref:DDE Tnp4 domain-containing protein n=1 Tax=Cuscuta europaea TaxID=41803 RepID=A0A9P0YSI4_CUSEU|nr:unnamed protein product [Cuscuta europaea]